MRAGGDDFALTLGDTVKNIIQGGDIFCGQHLEEELVTRAASWVACAGFTFGKHCEFHSGGVQQLDDGTCGAATVVVKCASTTNPEQVLRVLKVRDVFAKDRYFDSVATRLVDPRGALLGVAPPRIALDLQVFKHSA
ncbi:hypothetical protein FRC0552_01997 [Corynebacterium diphtheriae]|nr:hypothetical protein FRC0552_01997 [Corynebacterium diphtheriae]